MRNAVDKGLAIGIGAAYVAAFVLGLSLGRTRPKWFYPIFCGAFALIVLRAFFWCFPRVEYLLSNVYAYTVIQTWWYMAAAFLFLGLATARLKPLPKQALVLVCALALFAVGMQRIASRALFDAAQCLGKPGIDGICPQTTSFTCGAAAASTLLAHLAIESDEREMALLSWTNDWDGTDRFSLCKALHQKLRRTPYRPRLVVADWATLTQQEFPALVIITLRRFSALGLGLDHWVVVFDADETEVRLADPIGGPRTMPKDQFLRTWQGFALVVERVRNSPDAVETRHSEGRGVLTQ